MKMMNFDDINMGTKFHTDIIIIIWIETTNVIKLVWMKIFAWNDMVHINDCVKLFLSYFILTNELFENYNC
jgi:hypothetical protein